MQLNGRASAPYEIDRITVLVKPREGLSDNELYEVLKDLGNPVVDHRDGAYILTDEKPEVTYDPERDFEDLDLVWKCDFCGAYSRYEEVIVAHEEATHTEEIERGIPSS